ncbi:hypothetical protein B296_00036554, partial [Ensete ventricosum]
FDPNPAEIRLIDSNRVNPLKPRQFPFYPYLSCFRLPEIAKSSFVISEEGEGIPGFSHLSFLPHLGNGSAPPRSTRLALVGLRKRSEPSESNGGCESNQARAKPLAPDLKHPSRYSSFSPSLSFPRFFDSTSSRSIRGAMKLFEDLPPMDHLRSEDMSLVQIIIPVESAHRAVSYLGELGLLQLKDVRNPNPLNEEKSPFQRTFVNQVKRCGEMSRKLRFFGDQISKAGITASPCPASQQVIDLEELEVNCIAH